MGGGGVGCQYIGVSMVREWSALMSDSNFHLLYCTDIENVGIKIVSGYARESRPKEFELKWLKGVY